MANNHVLVDIFDTLHRLETKLEGQDFRLVTIEQSIRSGSISPLPDDLEFHHRSSLSSTDEHDWQDKPLPHRPVSSKATSPASLYAASIVEMRRRFEFVDDSQYDIQDPLPEPQIGAEPYTPQSLKPMAQTDDALADHDDAYTLSVYSSDVLSRRDLRRQARALNRSSRSQSNHDVIGVKETDKGKGKFVTNLESPGALPREPPPRSRTSTSRRSRSSRKSIDSQSSQSSQRSYERVAMTYYACDNFKQSLQGSRSLRSTERRFNMEEMERLKNLSQSQPVDGTLRKVGASQQGAMAWVLMLREVILRLLTSRQGGWSQRAVVVA